MVEIQRLGMWKSDVLDQNIDQSFEGNSPLHIIVKRTILYIAQTMLRCKLHQAFHYRVYFPNSDSEDKSGENRSHLRGE